MQIFDKKIVGLPRSTLEYGQPLFDLRTDVIPGIPGAVDSGEKLTDSDATKRRRLHTQVFKEARHLRCIWKRGERRPTERSEDKEMKPHTNDELEPPNQIQDLLRRISFPQDLTPVRVLHMGDDRVAMLNVGVLHRDEHDVRVQSFHDEVGCVR